jgi:hypothetical protein
MAVTPAETTCLSFVLRLRGRTDKVSGHEFHECFARPLYRWARRRGMRRDDAEDMVQKVGMQLYKAAGGPEYDAGRDRFRAYARAAGVHAPAGWNGQDLPATMLSTRTSPRPG